MRKNQKNGKNITLLFAVFFSTLLLSLVAHSQQPSVKKTIPEISDQNPMKEGEHPIDLRTPSNITTEAVYDPELGMYVVHTKIGDKDIITPFLVTPREYANMMMRQDMMGYFKQKNSENFEQKDKQPFNIFDMNFALGPLEKVFGPGGVRLTTQGSLQLSMGIKSNKTDNPSLSLKNRRKTYFDFDQKIQATINASVGDKLKFNMTYNTDATFDFDSKNIKLNYEGKEDEIIKSIFFLMLRSTT